ncbi:conserved protein of unknown function [Thermococcus nautili]|uniref:DUF835 domain-containing protein n=1 Tax=Thermococcus nautili TaxID=195522 RepID=UPI0025530B9D|nr:DUF835 domain-containing protein [Thermococcus nautili]CAI1493819.1 conserved protein of unknown function [Thermococcus nautili]
MNYSPLKLYLEVVKLVAVTLMLGLVVKRHEAFTYLVPKKVVKKAFFFLTVFWLGFVADVSNDIYPTEFTKVLDDIIISVALVFGAYLMWSASSPLRESVTPKKLGTLNGEPRIQRGAYLVYASTLKDVLDIVRGRKVLFVTRHPELLQGSNLPYIWVSKILSRYSVNPTNLHILLHEISKSVDRNTVIVLDALEYLILENGFKSVMKFLTTLKDIVIEKNATLLLVVEKNALDEKERAMLESEFQVLVL